MCILCFLCVVPINMFPLGAVIPCSSPITVHFLWVQKWEKGVHFSIPTVVLRAWKYNKQ